MDPQKHLLLPQPQSILFENDVIMKDLPDTRDQEKPNRVLCTILLRDDSVIQITNEQTIKCCESLKRKIDENSKNGDTVEVTITQFEPKNVRYVIDKAAVFHELYPIFKSTPEFNTCLAVHTADEVGELIEVAHYLNCQSASHCLGLVMEEHWDCCQVLCSFPSLLYELCCICNGLLECCYEGN